MKTTFGAVGSLLRIAAGVRLRREHFGGMAFATGTGTTVDVDRPVFAALDRLRQRGVQGAEALVRQLGGGRNDAQQLTEAQRLLSQLVDLAILAPASQADMKQAAKPESPESETAEHSDVCWPSGPHLAAPVTVHWAVTHQCTLRCPECYVQRHAQGFSEELTLPEALRLVTILADWGVFELAIGGGEPLEFPLLPAIVKEARRQGLVVHVTTGWHHVPAARLAELAEGLTGLQIGVKADRLLASPSTETAVLARTAAAAAQAGLHVGANLILSKQTLPHFGKLLELLQQAGLTNVTLLRYKPPADVAEWRRAKPPVQALREFESQLPEVLRGHPQITLRLDCALSFFQRHLAPVQALAQGLRGCVAGDRLLALTPDGSAFPCSQLVHPRFCVGNLLRDPLEQLWTQSPILRRYRRFRTNGAFQATACGLCAAKDHCGGCRALAADGWGAEPECPGPRVPPVNQLGKTGRRWDLARHLRLHGSISVRDYMQQYGVGQKRAIAELRAFGCPLNSGTGRKQSDIYLDPTEDVVGDIQDSIGYTQASFPLASREEIAGSIGAARDEADGHYPEWLRREREDDFGDLESARGF